VTTRIAVVCPVLDDWESFAILASEISTLFAASDAEVRIVAVDDGSVNPFDLEKISLPKNSCILEISIVSLALNLGHQRAIAVGLTELAGHDDIDAVFVMDSDGEDRPSDLASLMATCKKFPATSYWRAERSALRRVSSRQVISSTSSCSAY
jgi:hypothetical protein